jgi:hypothetical protein
MRHHCSYKKAQLFGLVFSLAYFFLVVLYDPLQNYVSSKFSFIDELMTFLFFFLALPIFFHNSKVKMFAFEIKVLALYLIILSIGLGSLIVMRKQEIASGLFDTIVFSKALVMYFACRILFLNFNYLDLSASYRKVMASTALFIFLLVISNKLFQLFPYTDIRFGIMSEELFFRHPSRFAFYAIFTFCILLPFAKKSDKLYSNGLLLLILSIGLFSLRIKYIGFFVVAMIALIAFKKIKHIRMKNPKIISSGLIALFLLFIVAYQQVDFHYSGESLELGYGRAVLLYKAFDLGNEYFPFGAGFGTYGSYYSGVNYSQVYYDLEVDRVYGLAPDNFHYIADTFWPMLLGQFGYLGLICFIFIVILFLRKMITLYNRAIRNREKLLYLSGILLMLALLIASSGDAIFTQNRAVASFLYFSLIINYAQTSRKTSK